MPRRITPATVQPVDDQPRRFSALLRWRLLLAGAGVAVGLTLGTAAWAGECTGGPPNKAMPNDPDIQCNCNTAAAKNNVWTCSGKAGTYTCVPSASSMAGYECAQTPGPRGPGAGAPSGSGGGTGTGSGGGSVPGKKTPPVRQ
jgi:hypothetical protein